MNDKLSVVACQMNSSEDVATNLSQILDLLSQIKHPSRIDLISFPENCLFLRADEKTAIESFTRDQNIFEPITAFARRHRTFIHLGSVPLQDGEKLYSTSLIIDDDGVVHTGYSKIHLFDVDVEGHVPIRESAIFSPGDQPKVLKIRDWSIGLSICYDIRFSELFLHYSRHPVDVILLPAAFLVPTGRAHWEILLRARAIESQAYVVAAAQWGVHKGKLGGERHTYGHSLIIDPWGTKLVEAPDKTGIIEAELDRNLISKVRLQIPMKNHRRLK